jgi:hypothetical protein
MLVAGFVPALFMGLSRHFVLVTGYNPMLVAGFVPALFAGFVPALFAGIIPALFVRFSGNPSLLGKVKPGAFCAFCALFRQPVTMGRVKPGAFCNLYRYPALWLDKPGTICILYLRA